MHCPWRITTCCVQWCDCRSAMQHCSLAIESFTCKLVMAQENCSGSGLTNVQATHPDAIRATQHVCSVSVQCHCMPVSLWCTAASFAKPASLILQAELTLCDATAYLRDTTQAALSLPWSTWQDACLMAFVIACHNMQSRVGQYKVLSSLRQHIS
jgi:hypothetical protein